MRISLAHSPDSDDAFMFYGLASGHVETDGLQVEHVLQDIESLNRAAEQGRHEITAISFHAYPYVADRYALMPCGGSIGDGYGPLLVARDAIDPAEASTRRIAVPGERTSAFLALKLFAPGARTYVVPFDHILDEVREGRADLGLVIHEGQLTYGGQGLRKVLDLGAWWKQETGLPLPLGGNAVRRDLGPDLMARLTRLVRETVRYSLAHRADALQYALGFARGMDPSVADRFVGMWVNDMTVDCGPRGREAVQTLLDRGHAAGIIPRAVRVDFVEVNSVPAPVTLPSLSFPDVAGRLRALSDAWASGPGLVLVGHSGCDTTRFTLPFVDRIHRRRGRGGVAVVLQDEPDAARELIDGLGLDVPVLLEPPPYPLVAALGLTVVPTLYEVAPDGRIDATVEAFQREALEQAAARLGVTGPLFTAADGVPVMRPG